MTWHIYAVVKNCPIWGKFWYKPLTDTPNVLNGQMEDDKPILIDTKKTRRTRNTRHVVHSDEESEEDSQEKDECKFKESSPKRKRTISIIEDGDSEKDGTENYSKTSIRLTGVDKGSKKKGIQNDNHVSFLVHFHVLS